MQGSERRGFEVTVADDFLRGSRRFEKRAPKAPEDKEMVGRCVWCGHLALLREYPYCSQNCLDWQKLFNTSAYLTYLADQRLQ
jgi:hypothetical protein